MKIPSVDNHITRYCRDIEEGRAVVGQWLRLAYEYICEKLEDGTLIYDDEKGDDAVDWIESHCFHTEGPLAPGSLILENWQKAFIATIFGIVDHNGLRQFREIVLIVARKNGKSALMAAIAKYVFQRLGGFGTRIFCIAPKLEQADIVYNGIWQMIQLDPEWQAMKEAASEKDMHNKKVNDDSMMAKHRQTDLYIAGTNSTVKKIAFSARKSDGFNPSLTICDEIASWQGDAGLKQYEVMKSAMGARPEGLLLSCSTSGYVNDGIFDELLKRCTRFLKGDSKETRLFPALYIIDNPDQWDDMTELRKSNPNLGVSVSEDYMREEIAIAEGSISKKAEFMTKYCNIKQNSALAWLSAQDIEKASGSPLRLEDYRGKYCVVGIDLSRTTDLTACTCVIDDGGKLNCFAQFFMPGEKLDEASARDALPYKIYAQRGLLTISGDNFVDYRDCYDWVTRLQTVYGLYPIVVGYDRYSAQYLVQQLNDFGYKTDDVFQGYNLTPVIREFEGLLKDGRINVGDNDLLKIHLLNTALKIESETERMKIVKLGNNNHIDGTAALLDAFTVRQKWYSDFGVFLER